MSQQEEVKILVRLNPKNKDTDEYREMLKEFKAEDVKFDGIVSLPKNNTYVTDEKDLVFIYPDRIDFAVAFESGEYTILTEQ